MPINSNRKGKRFEREIASRLTLLTPVQWHRVPQSGAFSTRTKTTRAEYKGDVFTEKPPFGHIVVECKITKQKITAADLTNPRGLFWSWIKQAREEAGHNPWILIFRDGTRKTFVASKSTYDYAIDQDLLKLLEMITEPQKIAIELEEQRIHIHPMQKIRVDAP